jgi:hypothetical protein
MSNMTTLGNVFDRVHKMSRNYHDKLIEVKEISFESLETISISDELHRLKPIAQQSISNRLGIPFHYLRKCPSDIQRLNLNHWLQYERNEELFFRFNGDDVRAIFTPRYIPTDNLEVLDKLKSLDYPLDTRVQSSIDDEFMMINIPDGRQSFTINGERMTPGISVSNSEVGLASLSIAAFVLRLVCTNGMISKTQVSASYRHISGKILSELPKVLNDVSSELGKKKDQFRLSIESKVEHPEMTISSFNNQFQLNKEEKEAVEWAMPLEYGQTMFHIINVYTKAAQYPELPADSGYKLQKVGGMILEMVK